MAPQSPPHGGALIFAFDEPTRAVGHELINLADHRARLVVCNTGEALRLILRSQPQLAFVCSAPQCLDESTGLISALHRRRPELPLLAIAAKHEPSIERATRGAGTQYYFALDTDADRQLLIQTLESIGFLPSIQPEHSPPRSRGRPPIRAGP